MMNRFVSQPRISLLAAILLCLMSGASAETPEAFATKYFNTIKKDGMKASLQFLDKGEVQRFGEMLLEALAAAEKAKVGDVLFGGIETVAELKKLPMERICEKFLRAAERTMPGMDVALRETSFRVIGHVPDGALTYVLVKASHPKGDEVIEVLPLIGKDGNYAAMLNVDTVRILNRMKHQFDTK